MEAPAWIAILGALLGVAGALLAQFVFVRRQGGSRVAAPPIAVPRSVVADLHTAAVEKVAEIHAEHVDEIATAISADRPASALAALLNEGEDP